VVGADARAHSTFFQRRFARLPRAAGARDPKPYGRNLEPAARAIRFAHDAFILMMRLWSEQRERASPPERTGLSSHAQEVVMATKSNLSKAELARGVAGAASALVLSALVLFVAAHHLSGG
jgi:hypothetical protein